MVNCFRPSNALVAMISFTIPFRSHPAIFTQFTPPVRSLVNLEALHLTYSRCRYWLFHVDNANNVPRSPAQAPVFGDIVNIRYAQERKYADQIHNTRSYQ